MKKQIAHISTVAAATATYFSFTNIAFAQAINICPGDASFGGLCNYTSNSIGPVLSNTIIILLIAAVVIALFFLIFGGIRWITSGGDKSKVESARGTIIAAIIGLIIALLSFFILSIVLGFFGISIQNFTLPNLTPGGSAAGAV